MDLQNKEPKSLMEKLREFLSLHSTALTSMAIAFVGMIVGLFSNVLAGFLLQAFGEDTIKIVASIGAVIAVIALTLFQLRIISRRA